VEDALARKKDIADRRAPLAKRARRPGAYHKVRAAKGGNGGVGSHRSGGGGHVVDTEPLVVSTPHDRQREALFELPTPGDERRAVREGLVDDL